MSASPDAKVVEQFLGRVWLRLMVLRAVEGAIVGSLLAALLAIGWVRSPAILILAPVGAIIRMTLGDQWRFGWWRSLPRLAEAVERRTSRGRNLVVTAAELIGSATASGYVVGLVMHRAARVVRELEPSALLPAGRAVTALLVAVLAMSASVLRPAAIATPISRLTSSGAPSVQRVEVTVVPPSYTGLPQSTTVNASRIEVLAASRIELRVLARASTVSLETLGGARVMERIGESYSATLSADSDGFLAIEPRDSSGAAGPRHLIGVVVTPDRAPRVTLTSPGRDLFFSTVPAALPVAITADDDLALGSVRLRYTAVSGSGERFTFVERDVPVTIAASSPRAWSARGTWRLNELGLSPGDLVVYRAVATDRRPGAPPVESDSYVLEVVTPGAIAAEGFAADDERDRYAVSQQMVILKTERLLARRTSLHADSVNDAARLLAAEQRQVRAEFVFMMGGELEDAALETTGTLELNEVAEAEAEGDLLAGRLQNQGRVDMMRAIRAMSRASSALTDANLDRALRDERVALENLMRAFARSRFILRALTQRERVDLDRRLSGALRLTSGLSAPSAAAPLDNRTVALRRLMADLAAMANPDSAARASAQATSTALALVRTAPGSDTLRRLMVAVEDLASQSRSQWSANLRTRIDSLLQVVSSLASTSLPMAAERTTTLDAAALDGALRDARSRGRRP